MQCILYSAPCHAMPNPPPHPCIVPFLIQKTVPHASCQTSIPCPMMHQPIVITGHSSHHPTFATMYHPASSGAVFSTSGDGADCFALENIPYTLFWPFAASVIFENCASGNLFPALRLSRTLGNASVNGFRFNISMEHLVTRNPLGRGRRGKTGHDEYM